MEKTQKKVKDPNYKKYQHIEHFGKKHTHGILSGTVVIFPKIDGTNGKVWMKDGVICAGSRNHQLDEKETNRNFYTYAVSSDEIKGYFEKYPDDILFGEWLVQHQEKYHPDAYNVYYVFDVVNMVDGCSVYQPYNVYSKKLDEFKIRYIPCLDNVENPEPEQLYSYIEKATFLKENNEPGEGIVFKNYGYKNKYGHQTWAKIIRSDFKKKKKERVANSLKPVNEQKFVDDYFTEHYCRKEMLKFLHEKGVEVWDNKFLKEFVPIAFQELISEEFADFLFTFKKPPTINFGTIRCFMYRKAMEFSPK